MDGANEVAGFIESVGIPVATVVLFAAGGWWLIRYILTEIVRKSSEDKDEIKQCWLCDSKGEKEYSQAEVDDFIYKTYYKK